MLLQPHVTRFPLGDPFVTHPQIPTARHCFAQGSASILADKPRLFPLQPIPAAQQFSPSNTLGELHQKFPPQLGVHLRPCLRAFRQPRHRHRHRHHPPHPVFPFLAVAAPLTGRLNRTAAYFFFFLPPKPPHSKNVGLPPTSSPTGCFSQSSCCCQDIQADLVVFRLQACRQRVRTIENIRIRCPVWGEGLHSP